MKIKLNVTIFLDNGETLLPWVYTDLNEVTLTKIKETSDKLKLTSKNFLVYEDITKKEEKSIVKVWKVDILSNSQKSEVVDTKIVEQVTETKPEVKKEIKVTEVKKVIKKK